MKELLEKMAAKIVDSYNKGLVSDPPTGLRFCIGGEFWRVKHQSGKAKICKTLDEVENYLRISCGN